MLGQLAPAEVSRVALEPGAVTCSHCGEPVPADQLMPPRATPPGAAPAGTSPQFCCLGCRTVYRALRESGLVAYYDQRARYYEDGLPHVPAKATQRDYASFDDPTFLGLHATEVNGRREIELYLEGMHCPACLWLVEKLPASLPGVHEARASFAEGRLRIAWDPARLPLSRIARQLDSLGYPPHPARQGRSREQRTRTERALLLRIGVAGAAFGNVMLLGLALYSGEAQGMNHATAQFFRWLSFAVAVPSVLWTASTFYRGALAAVRTRTPHMDLPISIGITAALLGGTHATLTGRGEIYFDTVTMLVFLLLIGRWLQSNQQRKASEATDLMAALAPSTSRLVEANGVREVPTESIPVGALIELAAGDRVGVDAEVIEGHSNLDESLLSGESAPVKVGPGDAISAGTINVSSRLLVRATRTGSDTRLAELVRQMQRAAERKPPIVLFADRMSGIFLVVVLSLAALTLLIWGWSPGIEHATALLIVTCPCALGLATPLAGSFAIGRAARRGILIKGMASIEALSKPGLVVFDKTGTLTQGKLSLVDFEPDAELAALVRAAERGSAHPVAQALLRDLPLTPALEIQDFAEVRGGGARAVVEGRRVWVGHAEFVGAAASIDRHSPRSRALLERGLSPLYVAVDGELRAIWGLGDPLRDDARDCLLALQDQGYELAVLSGDRRELVERVVKQLGVPIAPALGEQSPEQKLRFVEQARARGVVLMVGDGVNDAAALAAATVGVAVHGGAEASLAAADVFATSSGLSPLVQLTSGARRTLRVIHRNLAFSSIYNLTAAGLAVAGLITPLWAAVLMPLSSLTVLANSLRSRTFEDP